MSNLPQRYPTVYECKIGQGQQGNCFKWALERVLSKIVITTAYGVTSFPNITLKYPNRNWVNNPLTDDMLGDLPPQEVDNIRTRIGLTQFFGDWIALYCGSEGDIKEAYLDVYNNDRVTDEHSFPNNNSMCGMTRPQSFANTPEVLMYNFSRIVNFILSNMGNNIDTHVDLLLKMRYPICLGIRDPTIGEIEDSAKEFLKRQSGAKGKTYAYYVGKAFVQFFGVLSSRNNGSGKFLDLKTVTLHRKPYVIYKGEQQLLVPQIDISVDNVSEEPTDKAQNNYFGDIMTDVNNGLYAEVSVYMPKENAPKYFEGLQTLTEGVALQKMLHMNMNLRSGNVGEKNILQFMSKQLPDSPNNFSGHSMALRNIRVDEKTNQIKIAFINSWDDQTYVEYQVDIFFRVDLHALQEVNKNPGHIRDSDVVDIQQKYMEISVYTPSCIPEYMLQMVASNVCFYRGFYESAPNYRVKLANNQSGWGIQPIKKCESIDSESESENELDKTEVDIVSSPFSQDDTTVSQDYSPNPFKRTCKIDPLRPIQLGWDVTPMEVCTHEKCRDKPEVKIVTGKRKIEELKVEDFDGGKKNKPKTNKRRAKPRKRVTRKLKKKRTTYRVKPCRILKRRTYKRK